jgi:hypothetical protein
MLFKLVNVPAMFQGMMNTILQPLLNQGVVVCLNNILIYTKTMEQRRLLVTKVFYLLQKALPVAACKLFFHNMKVKFLGNIINTK